MKRIIYAVLACMMLLSGCARPSAVLPDAETVAATQPRETREPETEPTLSPEEVFLQSLPERVREACELGFVEPDSLQDLNRLCTKEEVIAILQKVITGKFGRESWMYSHALTQEEADQEATRGWIATMLYVGEAETLVELESEGYAENLKRLSDTSGAIDNDIADILLMNQGFVFMPNDADMSLGLYDRYVPQTATVSAYSAYGRHGGAAKYIADRKEFEGDYVILSYALTQQDLRNGEKLMTWDENRNFYPKDPMTIGDMAALAVRYSYSIETPDCIAYEEIGSYDPSIITPELLEKETTLPPATCEILPAQWHGVRMMDLENRGEQLDVQIYEWELDAIRNAGFNHVQVVFDFGMLRRLDAPEGTLDENRIRHLDQILAWCMEKDIHLNLSCDGANDVKMNSWESLYGSPENAAIFARQWAVLARRYQDIPNEYLSFTLLYDPLTPSEKYYGIFFPPAVEAIREVSPDRCIIAEIYQGATGETMAAMGVALSSPIQWPDEFVLSYQQVKQYKSLFEKAAWPYVSHGSTWDSASAMANREKGLIVPDSVAAVAEKYGVGYMVSSWGPEVEYVINIGLDRRPSDETMEAYLKDMARTLENRGIGWCYISWVGFAGIANGFPLVEDTTYTQVGDHALYIDEEMTGWFRQINGVK